MRVFKNIATGWPGEGGVILCPSVDLNSVDREII